MSKKSVKGYFWKLKDYNEQIVLDLFQKHNVSEPLSKLLSLKNITSENLEKYLQPKIKDYLPNPFHLLDMDLAVDRVIKAIQNKEKITVFGDYDVDGATSSALLKRFFRNIGIDVDVYIPDRVSDGYGPNINAFTKIINKGTKLIICVDCGTSAHEPIKFAKKNGVDAVVIDHHIGSDVNPDAVALVNPNRLDETTEHKNLAAVGVTFLFCVALNQKLRESGFYSETGIKEPNLMSMLDIVALGTVCDVMSLTGLNRAFVTQGLKVMQNTQNVGLKALINVAGIENEVGTYHLGFILGPRINASGRIGEPNLGSRLLSTEDEDEANKIAYKLELYNNERRALEREVLDESIEKIEEQELDKNPVIFVIGKNWHEGVIGIVASRIKEKYNKPSVIISVLPDGTAKSSCRSIKNVDIGSVIIEAKKLGLVVEGGGHEMAGGFTTKEEKLYDLEEFFANKLKTAVNQALENKTLEIDLLSHPDGINLGFAKEMDKLGPYGTGNHRPKILIKDALLIKVDTIGKGAEHIRCILSSESVCGFGSGLVSLAFNVINTEIYDFLRSSKGKKINVVGTIEINNWNGRESVQLFIEDVMEN